MKRELLELAALFARLSLTIFGGPAAHIAAMRDEVVRRRRWLEDEQFLDLLSASNLVPGPSSTELAIHIGHVRAGVPGLLVAGLAFTAPASLVVLAFAWAYVRHGSLPQVTALLYGIKPVIIAIVAQALWSLGKAALKDTLLAAVAAGAVAASLLGTHELVVLLAAGLLVSGLRRVGPAAVSALFAAPALPALGLAAATTPVGLGGLFVVFLKIGAVLFGSGYVLLAFLRADLVERLGWLTETQLLDAVAVGQLTPGPLFTTATFIGYVLAGPGGALVATVAIFLPAFLFVAVSGPLVPWLRRSPPAAAFLDGVNAGSLALMAVVSAALARAAIVDVPTVLIAVASAAGLLWLRLSSVWLIALGALVGMLVSAAS